MLPKVDSTEWKETWNLETKINALNQAIQDIQEYIDSQIGKVIEEEIKEVREVKKVKKGKR